ncbi:alpha/beta hydrolase-fold protein [uncultured Williamsia sp.]|uniref:alpha/beta hydrolase n=1 Tax=uncultured Williamsia sp. TaxID=259311 RepID=UPI00260731DF|nr:alpha/beta hydrolase-fold protein [uncultured Williamsia sp.]
MGNNSGRHRAAEKKAARRRERTAASSSKRKAQFVLATSGVTAAAVALGVAGPAFAANPDQLRKDCTWASTSDQQRQIQTCTFYSNALGREVNVQVRASNQEAGGTEQGVYFLDGIGANNDRSTWANADVGEVEAFSKGVNLVLPAGGAGEWATNWQGDKVQNGVTTKGPQWETFLAQELPDYLNENFDVQKNNNAIVGVSMSGGPAIITALNNPTVFAVARSFSGFYQTDNAGGYQAIPYIQQTYTGISNGGSGMWGVPNTPGNIWAQNDVSKRIAEAKANGQTIIISVGNGIPPLKTILALAASQGIAGIITLPVTIATGAAIEMGSLVSTMLLNAQAVAQGLPVRFHYNFGSHDFYSWAQTAPQDAAEIEAALAAAQAKENTNTLAKVAGPSSTLTSTNAALAKSVSLVQSADGTSALNVPSKVATGSSSSDETAASGSTSETATGTSGSTSTESGSTTETSTPPASSTPVESTPTSSAPSTSESPAPTKSSDSGTSASTGSESTAPSTSTPSTTETSAPETSSTDTSATKPSTESDSTGSGSTGTSGSTTVTKTETTATASAA